MVKGYTRIECDMHFLCTLVLYLWCWQWIFCPAEITKSSMVSLY